MGENRQCRYRSWSIGSLSRLVIGMCVLSSVLCVSGASSAGTWHFLAVANPPVRVLGNGESDRCTYLGAFIKVHGIYYLMRWHYIKMQRA